MRNKVILRGNIAELIIENREGKEVARTIIDAEDLSRVLKQGKWSLIGKENNRYIGKFIKINGKNKMVHLNRFLLLDEVLEQQEKQGKKLVVDHINGCSYDNRKENLRIATIKENIINRDSVGVQKKKDKYVSYIYKNRLNYLGIFETFEEARLKRLKAEEVFFKEFSRNSEKIEELGLKEMREERVGYIDNYSFKVIEKYVKENTTYKLTGDNEYEMTYIRKFNMDFGWCPEDGLVVLNKDIIIKPIREI